MISKQDLEVKHPMNFTLSQETIDILEKDTGKSIDELRNTPL